jgi:hypothetical protein
MNSDKELVEVEKRSAENKPNESSGIYVRGFIKISDPESGEVILETAN